MHLHHLHHHSSFSSSPSSYLECTQKSAFRFRLNTIFELTLRLAKFSWIFSNCRRGAYSLFIFNGYWIYAPMPPSHWYMTLWHFADFSFVTRITKTSIQTKPKMFPDFCNKRISLANFVWCENIRIELFLFGSHTHTQNVSYESPTK